METNLVEKSVEMRIHFGSSLELVVVRFGKISVLEGDREYR